VTEAVTVFLNAPSRFGNPAHNHDRYDGLYKDFESAERLLKERYDWLVDWRTEIEGVRYRYLLARTKPDHLPSGSSEEWMFRMHLEEAQE